jgi:hypothetical protein
MITIEDQQKLLLAIGKTIEKPITAYAIGGTAMMFNGLKNATLDIDIVFTKEEDRNTFIEAITKIGYRHMNSAVVYGAKCNQPKMYSLDTERFDLFLIDVIDFAFSDDMRKRVTQIHEYGKNLKLCIAHPQDIIIMKCATDRAKDLEDAKKIVETQKIDWKALVQEAATQVKLGRKEAYFDLGEFLEKIQQTGTRIPQETLDWLFELSMKEAKKKKQNRHCPEKSHRHPAS